MPQRCHQPNILFVKLRRLNDGQAILGQRPATGFPHSGQISVFGNLAATFERFVFAIFDSGADFAWAFASAAAIACFAGVAAGGSPNASLISVLPWACPSFGVRQTASSRMAVSRGSLVPLASYTLAMR